MNENEKQLFKALCKFKEPTFDDSLLAYATPCVLGHLFFNRMQGVAYGTLKRRGALGRVNREFRNSLGAAFEQNRQKNESFLQCVGMLSELLSDGGVRAAMLKGAFLCAHYPEGYRTSNDIDLLVLPEDVTAVGTLLYDAGFRQGSVREGKFIPATRVQIITSKMMRGETVPYIREVGLPQMKYLEVDINFSLDYKNGDDRILHDLLARTTTREEDGLPIPMPESCDFFLHLCAHLYKEATTLPWIEMRRDMTLYKYADLYLLLHELDDTGIAEIFDRARALGLDKICAYAILETAELFDMKNDTACQLANQALADDPDFRLRVTSPKDKKILIYRTASATERFFMDDRTKDLREVKSDEKA